MQDNRSWFWPLVATALVLASIAAALAALVVENPVQPLPFQETISGDLSRCLGLLNLFAPNGDPLDRSDLPLLFGSVLAVLGCAATLRLAARRR